MLFVDDVMTCGESSENMEERLEQQREAMEERWKTGVTREQAEN